MVFADFLRSLVRPEDIVSRVGGARLGVLFPNATADRAEAVCQRIILTLSQIHRPAAGNDLSITASAGVARIAGSLDNTLKRAEMALFFAKANGRIVTISSISGILSTGNQPPSSRAADIVLATMWQARRG